MQTILSINITNTSDDPMSCWVILDEMLSKLQSHADKQHPDEIVIEPDGEKVGVGKLTIEDLPIKFYFTEFDEPDTTGLLELTTNPSIFPIFSNGEVVRVSFSAEATFKLIDVDRHDPVIDYRTWVVDRSRWSHIHKKRLYTLKPHESLSNTFDIGEVAECELISIHDWNEYISMAADLDYEWSDLHRRFTKRHLKATHYDIMAMWDNKIAGIEVPF